MKRTTKRKNTAKRPRPLNIRDLYRARTGAPKCRNPFESGKFVPAKVRIRKAKNGRPVVDIRVARRRTKAK